MDWDNLIGKNLGVDEVDHGQFDVRAETELATGCCFLIRSEVLENVGMFDERYFLYYEDADLSERIKRAGYKIIYEPRAVLWHKNAESSGGSGSDLQDYYITRNRLLFGMTYANIRTRFALVRESLGLLIKGRKWQKRGILDYYFKIFGKGTFSI
jgi:GT2 family glycosyltransferase